MAGYGGEWDLLFGDDASAQARAQALAQALRGQQRDALALQALTGGPRAASTVWQTMAANAQQDLGGLGQAAGDRLRMAMQERARQAQLSQHQQEQAFRERQFGETERHNRAVEARPLASVFLTGDGGQQFYANPRNPGAPVQPVVGPGGQPIVKPKQVKVLQPGDKKTIDELTGEINAIGALESKFKPEFAGGGPLGGAATALYQKLGSAGSKKMQEDAAFWADLSRLIDLPQRNAIFGASLSAGEKSSWEGAKNIRPGTSPELVKQKLAEMRDIMTRKLGNIGSSLAEEGYDPEAIGKRSGGIYGGGAAATPEAPAAAPRRRKWNPQTGALE